MRSLYDCLHAKTSEYRITCAMGNELPHSANMLALARGKPLEYMVCQCCSDYDEMGEPIKKDGRGWK